MRRIPAVRAGDAAVTAGADPEPMSPRRTGEITVLLVAMTLPSLVTWTYFVLLASHAEWSQQLAYSAGKTLQFGLPLFWIGFVCRQRLAWPEPSLRGQTLGLAFGLVIGALMWLLYHQLLAPLGVLDTAAENIRTKVSQVGITTRGQFVALAVFYSVLHALLEEYYWRWFVFGRLRRLLPSASAIGLSSVAFMAHHVLVLGTFFGATSAWTWLFSLAVAVGGAFWAWLYERSGSLYAPWFSHLILDAAIFWIGYDLVGGLFAAG